MTLDQLEQDDFEHALVDSAANDHPLPGGRERAWNRFAAAAGAIAAASGPTAGQTSVPTVGGPSVATAGNRSAPRIAVRQSAAMRAALRWLAIGAVGGSTLTLTFVRLRSPGRAALVAPAGLVSRAESAHPEPGVGVPPDVSIARSESGETGGTAPALAGGTASAEANASPTADDGQGATPGHMAARATLSLRQARSVSSSQSESLAAEVAALDSARMALDRGAADEALGLLDRYQRAFPRGKLLPEAQVARIEALAATGDVIRALTQAARFLDEYPSAPERGRVKALQATLRAPPANAK